MNGISRVRLGRGRMPSGVRGTDAVSRHADPRLRDAMNDIARVRLGRGRMPSGVRGTDAPSGSRITIGCLRPQPRRPHDPEPGQNA
jgi:hypothetical protein